jgi:hypothetical protein
VIRLESRKLDDIREALRTLFLLARPQGDSFRHNDFLIESF